MLSNPPFNWDQKPLAIQCNQPQNELLEQLLGKETNKFAWASFSYSPLLDFTLYAISKHADTPTNITCSDEYGKLLSNKYHSSNSKSNNQNMSFPPTTKNKNHSTIWLYAFIISLIGNVGFVYLQISHKPKVIKKEIIKKIKVPGPVQTKIVEKRIKCNHKAIDKNALEKEFFQKLKNKFPKDYQIKNLTQELNKEIHQMIKDKSEDSNATEYKLLNKFIHYVNFVNENILNKKIRSNNK